MSHVICPICSYAPSICRLVKSVAFRGIYRASNLDSLLTYSLWPIAHNVKFEINFKSFLKHLTKYRPFNISYLSHDYST